jgi:hypothetical protein
MYRAELNEQQIPNYEVDNCPERYASRALNKQTADQLIHISTRFIPSVMTQAYKLLITLSDGKSHHKKDLMRV